MLQPLDDKLDNPVPPPSEFRSRFSPTKSKDIHMLPPPRDTSPVRREGRRSVSEKRGHSRMEHDEAKATAFTFTAKDPDALEEKRARTVLGSTVPTSPTESIELRLARFMDSVERRLERIEAKIDELQTAKNQEWRERSLRERELLLERALVVLTRRSSVVDPH